MKNAKTYNREYGRKWRKKNKDKVRGKQLFTRYDLSQELWDKLFDAQGRKCAIGGSEEPGGHGSWHTDHEHGTKNVRGILCHQCNFLLGNARDSVERLRSAVNYLESAKITEELVNLPNIPPQAIEEFSKVWKSPAGLTLILDSTTKQFALDFARVAVRSFIMQQMAAMKAAQAAQSVGSTVTPTNAVSEQAVPVPKPSGVIITG